MENLKTCPIDKLVVNLGVEDVLVVVKESVVELAIRSGHDEQTLKAVTHFHKCHLLEYIDLSDSLQISTLASSGDL